MSVDDYQRVLRMWLDLMDLPVAEFRAKYQEIGPGWENAVDEYTFQVRAVLEDTDE